MNKYISTICFLFLFLGISCSLVEMTNEKTYTPPVLKNQPKLYYPRGAQEHAFTGNPKVLMVISKTGAVEKAVIIDSSEVDILDNAAVDYCKNLVFEPAMRNGVPVPSRIEMEIKFTFSNPNWDIYYYIDRVNNLYKKIDRSSAAAERIASEREVLIRHNEFIKNMRDGLNFNYFVEKVISPALVAEWKRDWNTWPMSFLLYHDFMLRFPDFDSLSDVKARMVKAAKEDIFYITNTPVESAAEQNEKENLVLKIKGFVSRLYPDVLLDDLGIDNKSNPGLKIKNL